MTRDEFKSYADTTLAEVIAEAEHESGRQFRGLPLLRWHPHTEVLAGDLAEALAERLFIDSEHIFRCVDIGVCDVGANGQPIIFAVVSGHAPRSFGPDVEVHSFTLSVRGSRQERHLSTVAVFWHSGSWNQVTGGESSCLPNKSLQPALRAAAEPPGR